MSRSLSACLTTAYLTVISLAFQSTQAWADSADATQLNSQSLSQNRPLYFTENRGQWDDRVLFKAEGAGGLTWFIERDGFTVLFSQNDSKRIEQIKRIPTALKSAQSVESVVNSRAYALKFKFQHILPRTAGNFLPEQTSLASASSVESSDRLSWNDNYFLGNDPSNWMPNCGNCRRVVLKDVWPGVDVVWRASPPASGGGMGGLIEFDFLVHPGADANQIRVECLGLTGDLEATEDGGELLLPTSLGVLRQSLPEAFQIETDGSLAPVQAEFEVKGGNSFGVALPEGHNPAKPLIVDPLVYSTYLGGGSDEIAFAIASDGAGGVVVTGWTTSSNFPTTAGAYSRSYGGGLDVFITRLKAQGNDIIYSTYLGGESDDYAYAIAADGAGGVFVTGKTSSDGFPTTAGAFDRSRNGLSDAFVARLNSDGTGLLYSTYLGGVGDDWSNTITPDGAGGVVVAGLTYSNDFPTTGGAYDVSYNGGDGLSDAFVTRLNSDGSGLIYSTYLGGVSDDWSNAITADGAGGVIVTGVTYSSDFPTTAGAFDRSFNGNYDSFVARLNAAGSGLIYSTYLGGGSFDDAFALAPDGAGGVFVAGRTYSADFPTTVGAFDRTQNGVGDAFVTHLNSAGSGLLYSTFIGGSTEDYANSLVPDVAGGVVVAGHTESDNFPTTAGAYNTSLNGTDAFVARLNASGTGLLYSTYLGGGSDDYANALILDGAGGVVVAGYTLSSDFPTSAGAFDRSFDGSSDAFVTRLDIGLPWFFRTIQPNTYVMIGSDVQGNFDPVAEWSDLLGTVGTDWRLSQWSHAHQGYVRLNELELGGANWGDPDPMTAGKGFWIIHKRPTAIDLPMSGTVISTGSSIDVPLNMDTDGAGNAIKGLTMLANPFPRSWNWNSVSLVRAGGIEVAMADVVGASGISPYAYRYNPAAGHSEYLPKSYTDSFSFEPGEGFWVLTLAANYLGDALSLRYNTAGLPNPSPGRDTPEGWELRMEVVSSDGVYKTIENKLGCKANSVDGFDVWDASEFGSFEDASVQHYFPHPEEAFGRPGTYTYDFRSLEFNGPKIWNFTIRVLNIPDETFTLTYPAIGDVPEAYTLILRDEDDNQVIGNMRQVSQASFRTDGNDVQHHFSVICTKGSNTANPIPVDFGIIAAYPNPFNGATKITFGLLEESRVSIRAFDTAGREVAVLSQGHQTAGIHSVNWNAEGIGSGIYYLRLEADNGVSTRKLVLDR